MVILEYNEFIIESNLEFLNSNLIQLLESEGKLEYDFNDESGILSYEWDFNKTNQQKDNIIFNKLKNFLSKLKKEDIKKYFYRLLIKYKKLPKSMRNKIVLKTLSVFLLFVSFSYLNTSVPEIDDKDKTELKNIKDELIDKNIINYIESLSNRSDFFTAQNLVKEIEKGYSKDRKDRGNWITIKKGNNQIKRFVGTNFGISATVLGEYLKRIPSKSDMKKLSYKEALIIYKKRYWSAQNLSEFRNQSVANIIYDGCVNHGIGAMKKILRKAYIDNGIKINDNENPFNIKYIKLANNIDQESLFESIKINRIKGYEESITFKEHGDGWLKRVSDIKFNK